MPNQDKIEIALNELKERIDELNKKLIKDITQELQENSKRYKEIIQLAGDLNARLS
jgi:prefoldin subunit 5